MKKSGLDEKCKDAQGQNSVRHGMSESRGCVLNDVSHSLRVGLSYAFEEDINEMC
jgi:hypothetical protein